MNGLTFEDIQKANATIKTTEIKGKDYAEVNQRIKAFRMLFPTGSIETEMVFDDGAKCVFKATVKTPTGMLLGTGMAFEKADSSFINKTSYIENCETSAVGRALAMCGIGIDTSIASKEEVENAINNQTFTKDEIEKTAKQKAEFLKYINENGYTTEQIDAICKHYGVDALQELKPEHIADYMKALKAKKGGK